MITAIINAIFTFITDIANFILSPINSLIAEYFPALDNFLTAISDLFLLISDYIGWVLELTGLSSETISLIVLFWTLKLTIPMLVSPIKRAFKLYRQIK